MFNGSIVALVTPFDATGGVDLPAFDRLVAFHLENGTRALVIAGTTGESATLSPEEYSGLLERAVECANGRIPVIAGTGSASTARAVDNTVRARALGADAVLVVTPYYNRPTQAGLLAHFTAVADSADLPLLLYNVPSRTAVDLQPETVERLAAHPRIVGIKEAVAEPGRVAELVDRCGPDFVVLSGDDGGCLRAMKDGATGVISVAANVLPGDMQALCEAAESGDWERADALERTLKPLFEALMIETNPIPVKWALFEMGLIGPAIRLPLTELAESCRKPLREALAERALLPAES